MVTEISQAARDVAGAIRSASRETGVGFDVLVNIARRESAFDPEAKAATSSAAGLFQFIEETWLGAVKTFGAEHGLQSYAEDIARGADGRYRVADAARRREILDLRFDAETSAALAGELTAQNKAGLEKRLGRAVNAGELYAAHFLGLAGAAKLISAPGETSAAALLPEAAAVNAPVFFRQGAARSVGEVLASFEASMVTRSVNEWSAGVPVEPLVPAGARTAAATEGSGEQAERPETARAIGLSRGAPPRDGLSVFNSAPAPLALIILQALDPIELRARERA